MNVITPDWGKAPANIGSLSTLRLAGVSNAPYDDGMGGGGFNLALHVGDRPEDVQQNRALLKNFMPAQPAWLTQIHGAVVVDAANAIAAPQADASITTQRGVACTILTADCLPVLFSDVEGTVVGAAHAGWRGLAGGVLNNTVVAMRSRGAGEILAWLGPAIGPQQFEVGAEVLRTFTDLDAKTASAFSAIADRPGKYLADIYQLASIFLASAGVKQILGGGFCTVSDNRRFYSYRRDGITGRMASLIWIK